MTVLSTDHSLVLEIAIDENAPTYGRTVSGYGGKIPTSYRIRYTGKMRRVYVMQYGNSGSAYIVVNGQNVFLDSDTEYAILTKKDEAYV